MLHVAKGYTKMGLSVIPLVPKDKRPLIDWKVYGGRLPTDQELTDWWTREPNANIGIVTGTVSGVGVVDADGQEGINACLTHKVTSPIIASTGEGRHYYFAVDRPLGNAVGVVKGVDIRGENGYVVAPPSVHSNGSRYVWVSNFIRSKLPSFPSATMDRLSKSVTIQGHEGWLVRILGGVSSGSRHSTLVKLASYLIPRHDYDYVKHAMMEWNKKNSPPLADEEVTMQLNDLVQRFKKGQYTSDFKLREAHASVEKTIEVTGASQSVANYLEHAKRVSTSSTPELCTGFTELDQWTWGVRKGEIYTVGARPGTGKSSFLITIANSLLKQGKRVLFVSTEMPEQEVISKLIAVEKGIPCEALISGKLDETGRVLRDNYLESFRGYHWYFCNIYEPNEKEIRKIVEQVQPDVLIFDHLQHIASRDEAYKDISRFVRSLKSLAMEYGVAVMVASQLNRLAGGLMPELHHLKECGTIEEESCVVVLLHKEDQSSSEETPIIVKMAKNRYGKMGVTTLMFRGNLTRFEDMNYGNHNQSDRQSTERTGQGEGLLRLDPPIEKVGVDRQPPKQEEKP